MRFTLATTTVLCGAFTASALALPAADPKPAAAQSQDVHLVPLVSIEEATAKVIAANKNATAFHPGTNFASQATCANVRVRTEWRLLSSGDKAAYVNAIKCLMDRPSSGSYPGSTNRYEDLVWVHQQMVDSIHLVGQFLPWHRYYLHVFEDILKTECGFNGPIPWWDETKDAGNFGNSPVFDKDYFGWGPAINADGSATCMVNTGVFRGTRCHIGPGGAFQERCLARGIDESLTAQCNRDYIAACRQAARYADYETCLERGPHGFGHRGIGAGNGAEMSDAAASPSDPIFFMHHSFVDQSWRIWQNDNANRLADIASPTNQDGSGTLTLDYVLTSRGLRPDVRVRDVMDTTGTYLCYKYNFQTS